MALATTSPRRSNRQTWAKNPSFGRDYLADALGWSRAQLDDWLLSTSVHSHLVFWHTTCVQKARRYNESIEWIKTGYFQETSDLEEDVLLLCLGEGSDNDSNRDASGIECNTYADRTSRTFKWTTIELWARTVWRIVQDNSGKGGIFEKIMTYHPAAAYGIVFDILSLAFHNIAWVKSESVWSTLITTKCIPVLALTQSATTPALVCQEITRQAEMDADPDATSKDEVVEKFEEVYEDGDVFTEFNDSDFCSGSEADSESVFLEEIPKKKRGVGRLRGTSTSPAKTTGKRKKLSASEESPKRPQSLVSRSGTPAAPTKASGRRKRAHVEDTPSKRIKQWVQSLPSQEPNTYDVDGANSLNEGVAT